MRCAGCKRLALLAALLMLGVAAKAMGEVPSHPPSEYAPAPESLAAWMIGCLGFYGLLALLTALVLFVARGSSCFSPAAPPLSRPTWSFSCCLCCWESWALCQGWSRRLARSRGLGLRSSLVLR